ncbi:hypothetical protein A2U01_0058606, partial [Trifolium medium]|nr:hypothetical protein [Trifolium medium]
MAAEAE